MAAVPSLPLPAPSLTPAEGFHSPPPFRLKSLLLQDSVPAAHPLGSPPLTIPLHNLHAFLDFAAEPNL